MSGALTPDGFGVAMMLAAGWALFDFGKWRAIGQDAWSRKSWFDMLGGIAPAVILGGSWMWFLADAQDFRAELGLHYDTVVAVAPAVLNLIAGLVAFLGLVMAIGGPRSRSRDVR